MPIEHIGTHHLLELYGCSSNLLADVLRLEKVVRAAARLTGLLLIDVTIRRLTPDGWSAVAVFREGRLCVQTWTREGLAVADLFSATRHSQPLAACRALIHELGAYHYSLTVIERQLTASGQPNGRLLNGRLSATPN